MRQHLAKTWHHFSQIHEGLDVTLKEAVGLELIETAGMHDNNEQR